MNYKPLPDYLTIKKSPIAGLGLFAIEPIDQGTYIGMTHIAYVKAENGVVRTPLGGFGNHSNTPNRASGFTIVLISKIFPLGSLINIVSCSKTSPLNRM